MKKIKVVLPVILLAVVLALSFISCKAPTLQQEGFDRSAVTILRADTEVAVGDIVWTVNDSEYLGSQIPNDTSAAVLEPTYGRFLSIDFTVENTGEEARTIVDLKVIDSKGREYPVCAEAYSYIGTEEACLLVDVLPGTSRSFQATFDVPLDAVDLILEVSDLGYPPEEQAYIDLGL